MRRILLFASATLLCALVLGCTASDTDYVRNHIAFLPGKQQPLLIAVKAPPVPASTATTLPQ